MTTTNLLAGWVGMLGGVLAGAIAGLFFHRDDWLGGYGSHRRRLVRLGHISFFGLGFLNLLFALTAAPLRLAGTAVAIASPALLAGAATMPACCYLAAWRKPLRHLFPIPVLAVLTGVLAILWGGAR
jgi:predicted membrane-bound dolichyl-phosphate-mannose-protein mannosyltransferase